MIIFNELKVTSNNKNLIIDVSVPSIEGYENVTISLILIETQDTFKDASKPNKPIMTIPVELLKNFRIEVPISTLGGSNNMYFVWVTNSAPTELAECGTDTTLTLDVTYNKCPIYNNIMLNVRELDKVCSIPKDFINEFLKYKALELSIKTCNYLQAIKYFNDFFKVIKLLEIKSCGCYG